MRHKNIATYNKCIKYVNKRQITHESDFFFARARPYFLSTISYTNTQVGVDPYSETNKQTNPQTLGFIL